MISAKSAAHFPRSWHVRSLRSGTMNLLRFAWRFPRYVAVALITIYRWTVSPLLGSRCKYHPSCSQYAIDAYKEFGFLKGTVLATWRLLRCNPWSRGGVDYAHDQQVFK